MIYTSNMTPQEITHKKCVRCCQDLPVEKFYRIGRYAGRGDTPAAFYSTCKPCSNSLRRIQIARKRARDRREHV